MVESSRGFVLFRYVAAPSTCATWNSCFLEAEWPWAPYGGSGQENSAASSNIHPSIRFSPRDLRFGSASNAGARCLRQACTKWKLQPNIATICNYYTVTSSNICFFSAHWLSGEPIIWLSDLADFHCPSFVIGFCRRSRRRRPKSRRIRRRDVDVAEVSEVQPGNRKN